MSHFAHPASRRAVAIVIVLLMAACAAMTACHSETAKRTASEIRVSPSFSDEYEKAAAAVQEKAPDAKLAAVRSSTYAARDEDLSWIYLFVSAEKAFSYTVFVVEGQPSVADYAAVSYSASDLEAIPDPSQIPFDADKAYEKAVEQLEGEKEVVTCKAFMLLHDKSDNADPAEMTWRFVFNEPETLADEGINDTQGYADKNSIDVDALTGEASRES
jgi:hypothetical protein